MRATCDVAIAGGGIIGCAIAQRLSAAGRRVVIVDGAAELGRGATSAAMGGIITETDELCLGPLRELVRRSRDLYPAWLESITGLSEMGIPLLSTGALQIALDDDEMTRLNERILPRWRAIGAKAEPLSRKEVLRLEPLISRKVRGGFHLPTELALEPTRLMSALSAVLRRDPKVEIRLDSWAERVDVGPRGVIVALVNGSRIEADQVVVAGGHLSGALVPSHASLMVPIKGEAMEVLAPGTRGYPMRYQVYTCISGRDSYVVPRTDGRLAVGVTHERGRSDTVATARNLAVIRRDLATLAPEAATWRQRRHWAGVRPGTLDGIPLMGLVEPHGRLVLATGHVGLGITLAPVTAELVGALVDHGAADDAISTGLLELCHPARFIPAVSPFPTER